LSARLFVISFFNILENLFLAKIKFLTFSPVARHFTSPFSPNIFLPTTFELKLPDKPSPPPGLYPHTLSFYNLPLPF